MKVLYVQVLLEKSEHMSQPVWLYPWELPVFAAAHRNNGVTELRRATFNKRFAPNAQTEYDRIANRYKGPEGTDMSYASAVYGHGSEGVKALHARMVEAAKETSAFIAAEAAAGPQELEKVKAPEFASPFEGDEIPAEATGIETQADLRRLVSGETVEASA